MEKFRVNRRNDCNISSWRIYFVKSDIEGQNEIVGIGI